MKAVVITSFGGPEVLAVADRSIPVPDQDEVLVQVRASGLNRADIFQRMGKYPAPAEVAADIPGLEVSGVVVACGPNVSKWKPGDKVCALLAGGGYAEYVKVQEGLCLPVPEGWSFPEAASLPEAVLTVWSNVFDRGRLQPGETLLVHGGSSGIGVTAIQLASALGARVIVTVGSDEKGRHCLQLGAEAFINYKLQDFESILEREGVDVILDMVGGHYLQKNLNILKADGRLVHINAVEGDEVSLSIKQVMQKRITITGSTLRSREYAYKKQLTHAVYTQVWPIIQAGKFRPVIYRVFSFRNTPVAHELLEQHTHTGKIILEWEVSGEQ